MPEKERSPKGRGPEVHHGRRKLLQTGLALAATALALDLMAAARPATSAVEAATNLRNRGQRPTTDSQRGAQEGTPNTSQTELFHPTETHGHTAVRRVGDGTLAQQGNLVPEMGQVSLQDGLHWLEQQWQEVLKVGTSIGMIATAATIAKFVHDRSAANKAMESSFQHALALLGNTELESQAAAATELLYLLSTPRSEKYHQRIFATAVDHFRQRKVEGVDQQATIADFKFVPVLVFAASAIRDRLRRKRANFGAAREEYLNASDIHLDGLSLREADLSFLIFKHATFNGAVLGFANFSYADLTGADLSHTTLNSADLSHAILSGTNLSGARARDADLRHARLRNTNLEYADLSYAHLEAAGLSDDAHVAGANMYRATGLTDEMRKKCLEMGAIEQDTWGQPNRIDSST